MVEPNTHQREDPVKQNASRRCIGRLFKRVIAILVMGLVFWLLWNWAGVGLFTFPQLTYLQALAAVMASGVLIGITMWTVGRRPRHPYHRKMFSSCRAAGYDPDMAGTRDIL